MNCADPEEWMQILSDIDSMDANACAKSKLNIDGKIKFEFLPNKIRKLLDLLSCSESRSWAILFERRTIQEHLVRWKCAPAQGVCS